MTEALLYEKIDQSKVHCFLCAHHCIIALDKFGACGARQNINGILYTHAWGRPVAMQVDPIEKKPLYHFLPGSKSFSLSTIGCNFRCGFCQNWEISQARFDGAARKKEPAEVLPEAVVEAALKNQCQSIAYTYAEPTIFFEYAMAIAAQAKAQGLANIFVTNGYMTKECLLMLKPYLDAANVDLKFFSDNSYKKVCGGTLSPVLDSIRLMHELGIWVEVTTLIIPGENDTSEELRGIAKFIAGVDRDIPWHISRFHPDFEFGDRQATPEDALKKAGAIAKDAGLTYIYAGNLPGRENDTYCPACKKTVIKREIFDLLQYNIRGGRCAYCQGLIPGKFF
jgi:pyruvate formate lyase activating enzyme